MRAVLGRADAYWKKIGAVRVPFGATAIEADIRGVQGRLDREVFERAWDEGRTMDMPRVVACALRVGGPRTPKPG
jgi:hypothetical protein